MTLCHSEGQDTPGPATHISQHGSGPRIVCVYGDCDHTPCLPGLQVSPDGNSFPGELSPGFVVDKVDMLSLPPDDQAVHCAGRQDVTMSELSLWTTQNT